MLVIPIADKTVPVRVRGAHLAASAIPEAGRAIFISSRYVSLAEKVFSVVGRGVSVHDSPCRWQICLCRCSSCPCSWQSCPYRWQGCPYRWLNCPVDITAVLLSWKHCPRLCSWQRCPFSWQRYPCWLQTYSCGWLHIPTGIRRIQSIELIWCWLDKMKMAITVI
jgi:hypothetical protein